MRVLLLRGSRDRWSWRGVAWSLRIGKRSGHVAPFQRSGQSQQVTPMLEDSPLADLALEPRCEVEIARPGIEPLESLVAQVADAGRELHV